jgi:predicted NBD/HSP70 family sugar kinase
MAPGHFRIATVKTARDINRRIVLNLIRRHQPISRAELARHSRLQRSTVSAITEQLIAERWVTMGACEDIPRGRKPTFLHINGDRAAFLGIDVRAAVTTLAAVDLNHRFLSTDTLPTHHDVNLFISELCRRMQQIIRANARLSFEAIGMVLPGRIDLASGRLAFAPNLSWKSVDLRQPIEKMTGLPVELENAANACALAETYSGRHPDGMRNLVAITITEGIGVGMICNGQIVRGSTGFAGEFGHVTVEKDGPLCNCGNRGCLEVCASNMAAVRYCNELLASAGGRHPGVTGFEAVLSMAGAGNAAAVEALHRVARYLGAGISMLIKGLSPDLIVLVGEITSAWEQIGPVIFETVARHRIAGMHTRIIPTDASLQPRLRGACALVLQKHFGTPHFYD